MATQAERTADTCGKLLDATVAVLVERGYRGTSTPEICRRAGMSRGAQVHHYPTKEALVGAAVEHMLSRRLAEVQALLAAAPSTALDLEDAAGFLWAAYTGATFYAWLELVVAARTDAALRAIVADVDARFTRKAERLCATFLMPHVADPREVAATTRLILAVFDGLATNRIVQDDPTIARRALRVAVMRGLFTPRVHDAIGDA